MIIVRHYKKLAIYYDSGLANFQNYDIIALATTISLLRQAP